MKHLVGLVFLLASSLAVAQVDTSFVYNTTTPFGTLDIRLAKSATRYYYLQENITFNFRESSPGVRTNSYKDMTSWDSSPYTQGNLREKNGSADYFIMNYRLLFPQGYNANFDEGYPLIVMMHGAGERGNCWDTNCHWATRTYKPNTNSPVAPTTVDHSLLNNDHNLAHGGSPHLTARNLAGTKLPNDPTLNKRAFPGFVLFAQNLNGWDITATQDVIRLIRLAVKKYNINPNRIYVHGLSNGGSGTYEIIKRAPWLFAAALPMSAVSDASIISRGLIPRVAHIPIWTFQGGIDTSPTPGKTNLYVKNFRDAGMDVRYSLYANLGHGTWNTAYNEPDFFSWILSKSKTKLHVFYGHASICQTTGQGAKLGLSPGFRAYQWEKDGVIMPDVTSNELTTNEPGVFRARFSRVVNPTEADWNEWSQPVTVTVNNPAQAQINVLGTQFMRGPDNNSAYNVVFLKSENTNDKYYWYKNNVLVNIPLTTLDDTTRVYRISASGSTANGTFTLLTRGFDNCPSPVSEPVNLYFGNSGPLLTDNNIPTNFAGAATSASEVDLTWTDNSTIETGFEIWRRKPGSAFVLAGKTGPNVTGFHDMKLEPLVAYQYKIRAITASGRSKYAPGDALTINLVITTLEDTEVPTTPPTNVTVVSNTTSTIALAWTPALDNTGIRRYHITYGSTTIQTPTGSPNFTLTGLPMNMAYNISVVAEDFGGHLSAPSEAIVGTTYVTGLTYGHSTAAWTDLDQITNWNKPEFTGTVATVTLAPRTQEDYFSMEYKGYLYITNAGNYEFRTTSDDGSRLFLNGAMIVDNDGLHGNVTVTSGVLTVASGPQDFHLRYFEYNGGQSLTVSYRGPDTNGTWITIPASAFRSGSVPPTPESVGPSSTAGREITNDPALSLAEVLTVTVSPNPTSTHNIQVRVGTLTSDAPVQVKMIDMVGKAHFTNVYTRAQVQEGVKVTPNAALLNGMYIIIVNQGSQVQKEKIMIRN